MGSFQGDDPVWFACGLVNEIIIQYPKVLKPFLFLDAQEKEPKERTLSRAPRVRLCVEAGPGRAGTRPPSLWRRRTQTAAASLSAPASMLGLVTMGIGNQHQLGNASSAHSHFNPTTSKDMLWIAFQ
jgi:hypothetical protein